MSSHVVFVLQNQSAQQTLFLYNIHFITFYRIKLVSIKNVCVCSAPSGWARLCLDNRGPGFRLSGRLRVQLDTWVHVPNSHLTSNKKKKSNAAVLEVKVQKMFPLLRTRTAEETVESLAWGQGVCNIKLRCIIIIKQVFSGTRFICFHGARNVVLSKNVDIPKNTCRMGAKRCKIMLKLMPAGLTDWETFINFPASTQTTVVSGRKGWHVRQTLQWNTSKRVN